ncbi:MAG: tripartite tricarboxylate transporter substrate binding protein [Proteobacteria bacterium]|nr:tripartite tricarboxylate transporter substrate binding protein [Pseudomonadota bacterium]
MKKQLRTILLAGVFALLAGQAFAQAYPNRPIRWLVPYSAGGPADLLARAVAPTLGDQLGVPVVVENRVGAGGGIAMDAIAKAAPDGYMIGLGLTGTQMINPYLYSKLPYDPLKDFSPVTPLVSYTNVLLVAQNSPVKSVAELVAYAKANPDKVTFASGGKGASNHLQGELLKALTGAPMLHVPYKGNAQGIVDLISGNVTCMFDILATGLAQVRAGKVRALAVTGAKRSPYAPEIPTLAEAGVEGYEQAGSDLWIGVLAPPGTPKVIVDRLHAEFDKTMKSPAVTERVRSLHYDTWTLPPEEFAAYLRTDYLKWGNVTRLAGLKPE